MSYDLMVFDSKNAPKTKSKFIEWYYEQTEWNEEHDYNDPINTSEKLRNWFLDMKQIFPALNGPFASDDIDNSKVTDYCIGSKVIYAAFAWSEASIAYSKMYELAEKHKVGFYDTSGNGDIIIPTENGEMINISNIDKPEKSWWKFWN